MNVFMSSRDAIEEGHDDVYRFHVNNCLVTSQWRLGVMDNDMMSLS